MTTAPIAYELGQAWWEAEHFNNPPVAWNDLSGGEKTEILDRVMQVYERKVPKDELSHGDIKIVAGPHRIASPYDIPVWLIQKYWPDALLKEYETESVFESHNARITTNQRRVLNFRLFDYYDTVVFPNNDYRVAMFVNTNVGVYNLCNLSVANQISLDSSALITHWRVRTVCPVAMTEQKFRLFLNTLRLSLIVGDRPIASGSVLDLYLNREPVLAFVPSRQHMQVVMETFGDRRDLASLCSIAVHLHGWETRENW